MGANVTVCETTMVHHVTVPMLQSVGQEWHIISQVQLLVCETRMEYHFTGAIVTVCKTTMVQWCIISYKCQGSNSK